MKIMTIEKKKIPTRGKKSFVFVYSTLRAKTDKLEEAVNREL